MREMEIEREREKKGREEGERKPYVTGQNTHMYTLTRLFRERFYILCIIYITYIHIQI